MDGVPERVFRGGVHGCDRAVARFDRYVDQVGVGVGDQGGYYHGCGRVGGQDLVATWTSPIAFWVR
ncbi:hypothetical protein [Paractinoplanes toevensis]|uniref:hypothetical protein n=1 Tax=Paractinoplanes toevensis TaxID=571911 RepID=UPI001BB2F3D4|nr:hypothetical protein [Actinoplanes toevensis]